MASAEAKGRPDRTKRTRPGPLEADTNDHSHLRAAGLDGFDPLSPLSPASPSQAAGAGATGEEVPEAIHNLKRHHKKAFKAIDEALHRDAQGDFNVALRMYNQGLEQLHLGLACALDGGSGRQWDKARALQGKMASNLSMVTDRIAALKQSMTPKFVRDQKGAPRKAASAVRPSKAGGAPSPRAAKPAAKPVAAPASKPSQPVTSKRSHADKTDPPATATSGPTQKKSRHMANVDTKMADLILNEIVQEDTNVSLDDVIGMENAKRILHEIVVLPALRPDLMSGLRAPAKGLLLFGPPGNGKTMLAKAVANEAKCKFFSITASSLTSKYLGEGEKLVRALFAVARELQPSIVFIDEIDSLLTARSSNEHEASRRLKTELLIQMDGVRSQADERILVMGATNLPQEIDEAALRRMPERVFIPLPEASTRKAMLAGFLKKVKSSLSKSEMDKLASMSEGYSGSDLHNLARDAAMQPIREMDPRVVASIPKDQVRGVTLNDFKVAMSHIRPSVSGKTVETLEVWNGKFGSE